MRSQRAMEMAMRGQYHYRRLRMGESAYLQRREYSLNQACSLICIWHHLSSNAWRRTDRPFVLFWLVARSQCRKNETYPAEVVCDDTEAANWYPWLPVDNHEKVLHPTKHMNEEEKTACEVDSSKCPQYEDYTV